MTLLCLMAAVGATWRMLDCCSNPLLLQCRMEDTTDGLMAAAYAARWVLDSFDEQNWVDSESNAGGTIGVYAMSIPFET